MTLRFHLFIILYFFASSCGTGKLKPIADLPSSLKETSAIEMVKGSDLYWVIEDAGNKNNLYGLDVKGDIVKDLDIDNIQNIDWEDLTSDDDGNIYIGDFGNNSKKRENFAIYKVAHPAEVDKSTTAEVISFTLPKDMKSEDFESFFLFKDTFYIFSKDRKKTELLKVPNQIGNHVAEYISEFKFKGKQTKVTSADISDDGKTVVLLNHDKLWKLTNFTSDNFFNGTVEVITFQHDTQKEGIYLMSSNKALITDELNKHDGGTIYSIDF